MRMSTTAGALIHEHSMHPRLTLQSLLRWLHTLQYTQNRILKQFYIYNSMSLEVYYSSLPITCMTVLDVPK
jgi:hypothetical protein